MITRPKAFAFVALLWAALYLPGLGTPELDGQEGGRVIPAVEMLQNGRWIVPPYGGEDYYNKPPGINWLFAASFAVTGVRSELTARLPSVLMMLAFASMLIWTRGPWLGLPGRLIAAVVFLTAIGLACNGRHAYIEASYVCLTAMATLWWLNVWSRNGSRWLLWLVPAVLLAYGALIKGPILGVLFYCTVICVMAYARRLKELFTLQHFVGIAVILFLCLGWVYLAMIRSSASSKMTHTWLMQWLVRFAPDEEHHTIWVFNVLKTLGELMPWLAFVPLLWMKRFTSKVPAHDLPLFKGCRLSLAIGFVLIEAMPATLPRYALPCFPLAGMLLGWVLSLQEPSPRPQRPWKIAVLTIAALSCASVAVGLVLASHAPAAWLMFAATLATAGMLFQYRRRLLGPIPLSLATGIVTAIVILQYYTFTIPYGLAHELYRPTGQAISQAVPPGQTIYAYRPMKQKVMLYVRQPLKYLMRPEEIDGRVRYLVIQASLLDEPSMRPVAARSPKVLFRYDVRTVGEYRLVELAPVSPPPDR